MIIFWHLCYVYITIITYVFSRSFSKSLNAIEIVLSVVVVAININDALK